MRVVVYCSLCDFVGRRLLMAVCCSLVYVCCCAVCDVRGVLLFVVCRDVFIACCCLVLVVAW